MGNCYALCNSNNHSTEARRLKALRVVNTDGKIIEFTAPLLVKDLLVGFSGSAVGVSKEALNHLPSNYELKLGRIYYILPLPSSVVIASPAGDPSNEKPREKSSAKRIKIVITKKQLQELVSKQISVGDVLLGLEREAKTNPIEISTCWKPTLESIPEGAE